MLNQIEQRKGLIEFIQIETKTEIKSFLSVLDVSLIDKESRDIIRRKFLDSINSLSRKISERLGNVVISLSDLEEWISKKN